MTECIRLLCSGCGNAIEAWSDGYPFYLDEAGDKVYAYHPDHLELDKCIANDEPHYCLSCGVESNIDSRLTIRACSQCGSRQIVNSFSLEGRTCPVCRDGRFARDPNFHRIS